MAVPNDPANNPQPDVDLTVGNNQVVGDAPPSDGTGVSVSVTPSVQTAADTARAVLEGSGLRTEALRHFHTASARAAAFPGLQPEIESFGARGP
jgi:hypothetical protein